MASTEPLNEEEAKDHISLVDDGSEANRLRGTREVVQILHFHMHLELFLGSSRNSVPFFQSVYLWVSTTLLVTEALYFSI